MSTSRRNMRSHNPMPSVDLRVPPHLVASCRPTLCASKMAMASSGPISKREQLVRSRNNGNCVTRCDAHSKKASDKDVAWCAFAAWLRVSQSLARGSSMFAKLQKEFSNACRNGVADARSVAILGPTGLTPKTEDPIAVVFSPHFAVLCML